MTAQRERLQVLTVHTDAADGAQSQDGIFPLDVRRLTLAFAADPLA